MSDFDPFTWLVAFIIAGCIAAKLYALMIRNSERRKQQKKLDKLLEKYNTMMEDGVKRREQNAPWMAQEFADVIYLFDKETSFHLKNKPRPARKAAEEVAAIAREKRALKKQNKLLEYQISFYENAFPWLEEFKEIDAGEAWSYAKGIDDEDKSEYDRLKNWLSPEEYKKLPNSEKFQLALDRYCKRKKTNWEIGIDYERYIGYLLEGRGYKVKYQGALLGLEDMGRDLIASKDGETVVVQCKRWAQEKTIHEKHIFQLYGSVVLLASEHKTKKYRGLFVTTARLSDVARRCADYLGIEYYEAYAMQEYPMVKCNIAKNGEKIYHLPFDQQYDRLEIVNKKGAAYVATVAQAEKDGFRRAYRWHPNKE